MQLTWGAHTNQIGIKAAQILGLLGPFLSRRSVLSIRNVVLLRSSSSIPWWVIHALFGGPLLAAMSGICVCCNPGVSSLRLAHLDPSERGKFARIWGFHSSPFTSELWEFWLKVSWCGEPRTSANLKAFLPTERCLKSLTVNRGAVMISRPIDLTLKRRPIRRNE
jgi:hypothetical protein